MARKEEIEDADRHMRLIRLEIARGLKAAVKSLTYLSQNDLARIMKVTTGTMSNWLSGTTQPSLEEFSVLCHITNRSADKMIGVPYDGRESPDDEARAAEMAAAMTLHLLERATGSRNLTNNKELQAREKRLRAELSALRRSARATRTSNG